jgi:UPF0716 family protein affecting phage T7 exclusion
MQWSAMLSSLAACVGGELIASPAVLTECLVVVLLRGIVRQSSAMASNQRTVKWNGGDVTTAFNIENLIPVI